MPGPEPRIEPTIDLDAIAAEATALPDDPAGFLRAGWAYYGAGQYHEAIEHFETAQRLAPDDLEPAFGLGMGFKKTGNKDAAVSAFRKVAERVGRVSDTARGTMLRRLALGHANYLERGQWDLEREGWGRR